MRRRLSSTLLYLAAVLWALADRVNPPSKVRRYVVTGVSLEPAPPRERLGFFVAPSVMAQCQRQIDALHTREARA